MVMRSPIPLKSEEVLKATFAQGECCRAVEHHGGFLCTREAGHAGCHVAHGMPNVTGKRDIWWAWSTESARPCGCDPGANHVCDACQKKANETHQAEVVKDGPVVERGADRRLVVAGHPRYATDAESQKAAERVVEKHRASLEKIADTPHTFAPAPTRVSTLPSDPKERKKYPIATGVLFYFPDALAAVARVSYEGNQQHNPGQPLHWARGKSTDQHDTLLRHVMEGGKFDTDGQRHSAKAAWRALAILQLEIEEDERKKHVTEAA